MRTGARAAIVVALGLAAVSAAALGVANGVVLAADDGRVVDPAQPGGPYDCILVLGAGVRANGTPSPILADRLDTAIDLWEAGASERVLLSGDHGTPEYDEVGVMLDYLVDRGVPAEAVFLDHAGFETYDSMYRAHAVFQAASAVVVTQAYHLPRALYLADAVGLDAVGARAPGDSRSGQSAREIREVAARVKAVWMALTRPEPRFLGDPIPLTGDGRVTHDE